MPEALSSRLSLIRRGVVRIFAVDHQSMVTASPMSISLNCFCGASFSVQIPAMVDRTEQAAIAESMRSSWAENHFHQLNREGGPLLGKDEPLIVVSPKPGMGFNTNRE